MTILHLDRSLFFQKVLQKTGIKSDHSLFSGSSQEDALQILEKEKIDLILTGIELEDGPIDPFLKQLEKSRFAQIPVIILTSSDNMETRRRYFQLGVIDFIPKTGFSYEKLQNQLKTLELKDDTMHQLGVASIAVLDDSRVSLNIITSSLKMYRLNHFDVYTEPKSLLDSEKEYDIYFIDMILPGISGNQVVQTLRARYPYKIIIVISALDKYNTITHALEAGADDYIIKPFDSRLLIARLKANFRQFITVKKMETQAKQLEKMSITDSLTGAKNHRFLMARLTEEISRHRREGRSLCLVMIDLDHFKKVNDTYGHQQGDIVLKILTKIFQNESRDYDIFGRYGGEEFLFILPDTELEEALVTTQRIRELFFSTVFPGIDRQISFSGGLVEWYDESLETLLGRADALLYKAKERGRNRIETD